ncbi:MAG: alpha-L-rhamnosidase C-terminal domain-containing protein [Terrimicrobiaceae bacterium]
MAKCPRGHRSEPKRSRQARAPLRNPRNRIQWAEGVVPTPHGNIRVKWELRNGKCHVEYEAPPEISVTV